MLNIPISMHWNECYEYVKGLVRMQAKNFPTDYREDIVQDAMLRIYHALPAFQYQCMLRTWIFGVVRSCIIDAYRRMKYVGRFVAPSDDPNDFISCEEDIFIDNTSLTVEDIFIIHEDLQRALIIIREYVNNHSKAARNKQILKMVLFESVNSKSS